MPYHIHNTNYNAQKHCHDSQATQIFLQASTSIVWNIVMEELPATMQLPVIIQFHVTFEMLHVRCAVPAMTTLISLVLNMWSLLIQHKSQDPWVSSLCLSWTPGLLAEGRGYCNLCYLLTLKIESTNITKIAASIATQHNIIRNIGYRRYLASCC